MNVASRLNEPLLACAEGKLVPNVALMHLILRAATPEEVEAALTHALTSGDGEGQEAISLARHLWATTPGAFTLIKTLARAVTHEAGGDKDEALSRLSSGFDRAARLDPVAATALYTLGREDLRAAVVNDIIALIETHRLVGPRLRAIEIGCGEGRLAERLSGLIGAYRGFDISETMIALARARCVSLANVTFERTRGDNLQMVAGGSIDLVVAVDVFPYLVLAEPALARAMVQEFGRVLRPGGGALIANYSYRRNDAADDVELTLEAATAGLDITLKGERVFSAWDGRAFVLIKR